MQATEFTEYLKEQIRNHSIYVWGAQGQKKPTITKEWIRKRKKTERAVKRFQRSVGLKADGIAGRRTFAALGLPFS